MTTTFETMVMTETIESEKKSKKLWQLQNAAEAPFAPRPIFPLDSHEHVRIEQLRSKVSDLCDLQPRPASMKRPPRKVRSDLVRLPLPCVHQLTLVRVCRLPCSPSSRSSSRSSSRR